MPTIVGSGPVTEEHTLVVLQLATAGRSNALSKSAASTSSSPGASSRSRARQLIEIRANRRPLNLIANSTDVPGSQVIAPLVRVGVAKRSQSRTLLFVRAMVRREEASVAE